MSSTRDYIDYLNAKTDIAPANSQEELDEARLIQTLMEQHGLETTLQEFEANGAGDIPHAVALLALFVGIVLAGIIGTAAQAVGFVLILACVVLFVMRFALGRDVLAGLGARARSQNVIGIHRADGPLVTKGNRPIVVMAHYDTPNENFLYQEPFARYQALLRRVSPDLAIAVFVCGLVQAMMFLPEPLRRFFWIVGIICCLPLLLIGISYAYERFAPCTVGANDNKSGVAAMLGVMDDVRPGPDDAKRYASEHPYVEPVEDEAEEGEAEGPQDGATSDGDGAQDGAEPDSGAMAAEPVADTVLRPAAVSAGVLEDDAAGEAAGDQPSDEAYVPGGYDEDGQIVDGYEDAGAYEDDGPAAQPAQSIVDRAKDLFGGLAARFGGHRGSDQPGDAAGDADSENLSDGGEGQGHRSLVSQHRGPAPTVAAAPRGQAADWEHAQAEDDRYQYEDGSEGEGALEDRALSQDAAASGFQLDADHPQRHGLETIESLEMLPEDCEVVYRKPAQRRARLAQVPTVEAEEAPAAQAYEVEREDFGGGASQQTVTGESYEAAPDGAEPQPASDDLEGEPYIPYEPEGDYGQESQPGLAAFGQKASGIARAVADWFKRLWERIVEFFSDQRDKALERKAQRDAQKAEEAERRAEELARQQEEAERAAAEDHGADLLVGDDAAADQADAASEPAGAPDEGMTFEEAAGAMAPEESAGQAGEPATITDDGQAWADASPAAADEQGLPTEDYEDYGVVEDQDYLDEDLYEDEAYGAEGAGQQPEPEPPAAAQDGPVSDDTERLDATAAYGPVAADATQPLDDEGPVEAEASAPVSQDAVALQQDAAPAPTPVMAEGLTFSQEQDVSDEELALKDASGLETLSTDDVQLPADQKPKPKPIDDPNWGKSDFNPAAGVARRAVLFDLPNPASDESVDPFASEASEDVVEEAPVLNRHQVAEDAAPVSAEQEGQAREGDALLEEPSDPTASLKGSIDETARLAPIGHEDAAGDDGLAAENDVTAPLPSNGGPAYDEASGTQAGEKIPTDDAVAEEADPDQTDPDLMEPAADDEPAVDVGEAQPLETLSGDSMRPTYMDEPSYGFDGGTRPAGGSHKRKKKSHGGLRGLFSRKKKQDEGEESLSDWLGVSDDYDAKKDGRAIGTWSNFEQEEHDLDKRQGDDGSWKGGAAMRSNLRVVGDEEDLPIDEYGQVIQPPQPTEEEMRDQILHMGDDELICHDIYFVAVGANGLSNSGAAAFINQFRSDIRGCYLVNLDSVGAGDLTLLTKEGLDNPRRADRRTVRMLSGVFSDLHLPFQRRSYEGASTDATYAMRSRIRATTIMGQDASGIRAQSHTADDEPEGVDRKQVADVSDVVTEFIRRS